MEAERKLEEVFKSFLAVLFGPLNKTKLEAPAVVNVTKVDGAGESADLRNVSENAPVGFEPPSKVKQLPEKKPAVIERPVVNLEPLVSGENLKSESHFAFDDKKKASDDVDLGGTASSPQPSFEPLNLHLRPK